MKNVAIALAVYCGIFFQVSAFTIPDKPTGHVNDYANVISKEEKIRLEDILRIFAASTTNEIAVVVIPDLGGDTVERYAVTLFEKWKIGNKENDNGVLLLIAIQERELRIEVGYGLEGALPDITAKNIIDTQITPSFKQGDYALGISRGVDAIMQATKGEYRATESTSKSFSLNTNMLGILAIFGLVVIQYIISIFARSKSWWAGGIVGGIIGATITFLGIFGVTLATGGVITIILILLGLLFDYFVSNAFNSSVSSGGGSIPWWAGGGGSGGGISSSSGGSFGGFGGGSTGGGGSSGRW